MFESRGEAPASQRPVFAIGDAVSKKDKVSWFPLSQLFVGICSFYVAVCFFLS